MAAANRIISSVFEIYCCHPTKFSAQCAPAIFKLYALLSG